MTAYEKNHNGSCRVKKGLLKNSHSEWETGQELQPSGQD